MSKIAHVYNIPDFKNTNGNWVRSYYPTPYEQHRTRGDLLWMSINKRCKIGGSCQKKRPTYIGCVNGFSNFQEFASWCQYQYVYLFKEENGKYWSLDKDLIEYGNKVYCPEKCLFVPNRINCLLTASDATRGEYPLGVSWYKRDNKFLAYCSDGSGKMEYFGLFTDPFEAHQAWQKAKIRVMKDIISTDEEVKNHKRLTPIIEQHMQRLEDDLNNGLETT